MKIKTNFQQKIEGHKCAVFRLKKLSVHALPGLCTLNIFEYEISLSSGKFRNHHREPLFGLGNTSIGAVLWERVPCTLWCKYSVYSVSCMGSERTLQRM
jgi:hypothetical protein